MNEKKKTFEHFGFMISMGTKLIVPKSCCDLANSTVFKQKYITKINILCTGCWSNQSKNVQEF